MNAILSLCLLLAGPEPVAEPPPDDAVEPEPEPEPEPDPIDSLSPDVRALVEVAADAKAEAATAEAEAQAQEKKTEAAEAEAQQAAIKFDELKTGKLIRYGVTAGVGPAVLVPLHTARGARPGAAATALGYLMLHPAYWKDEPQSNLYCANHWALGGSAKAASKAADASAYERAEIRVASLFALLRVDPDLDYARLSKLTDISAEERRLASRLERLGRDAQAAAAVGRKKVGRGIKKRVDVLQAEVAAGAFDGEVLAVVQEVVAQRSALRGIAEAASQGADRLTTARMDLNGVTPAQLRTARSIVKAKAAGDEKVELDFPSGTVSLDVADAQAALTREIQATVIPWKSDVKARCGTRRFTGVWLGYPFPHYDVTVPTRYGDAAATRERVRVRSLGAIGYGISPNAYFSALAGVGLGLANLEPGDNDDEVVFTFVLSIGGNLDLFTIFRGIAQ